jgi:hypothetical protein
MDDVEWLEAIPAMLPFSLATLYFTALLRWPCLTAGKGNYRFVTSLFALPPLMMVGFFFYMVFGNLRDVYSVWPECVRILWYGLLALAPVGAAYTLADEYEGKRKWMLILKPYLEMQE